VALGAVIVIWDRPAASAFVVCLTAVGAVRTMTFDPADRFRAVTVRVAVGAVMTTVCCPAASEVASVRVAVGAVTMTQFAPAALEMAVVRTASGAVMTTGCDPAASDRAVTVRVAVGAVTTTVFVPACKMNA